MASTTCLGKMRSDTASRKRHEVQKQERCDKPAVLFLLISKKNLGKRCNGAYRRTTFLLKQLVQIHCSCTTIKMLKLRSVNKKLLGCDSADPRSSYRDCGSGASRNPPSASFKFCTIDDFGFSADRIFNAQLKGGDARFRSRIEAKQSKILIT